MRIFTVMRTSLSLFIIAVLSSMIGSGVLIGCAGIHHFIGDIILLGGMCIDVGNMIISTVVVMISTIITTIARTVMHIDRVRLMPRCVQRLLLGGTM